MSTISTFSTPSVPSFCDFEERAAIIEVCAGASRDQGECTAARQLGFESVSALFAAQITDWQERLSRTRATSDEHRQLIGNAQDLCRGSWIVQLLALGWDEVGLFGFDTKANTGGLVQTMRDGSLTAVTEHTAGIIDRSGQTHLHRRFATDVKSLLWDS
ncbi:MAG: hypothetical protein AAF732_20980 [Pseudomonadota bacterium]